MSRLFKEGLEMKRKYSLIAVMILLTAIMIFDIRLNKPFDAFSASIVNYPERKDATFIQNIELECNEKLFVEVESSRLSIEPTIKQVASIEVAEPTDNIIMIRTELGLVLKVSGGVDAKISLPETILPELTVRDSSFVSLKSGLGEVYATNSYINLGHNQVSKLRAVDSFVQLTDSKPQEIKATNSQLEINQAHQDKVPITLDITNSVVNAYRVGVLNGTTIDSTINLEYTGEVSLTAENSFIRAKRTSDSLNLNLISTTAYLELEDHLSKITSENSEVTVRIPRNAVDLSIKVSNTPITTNISQAKGSSFSIYRGSEPKKQSLKTQGGTLKLYAPYVDM